jgi:hypothetical protein
MNMRFVETVKLIVIVLCVLGAIHSITKKNQLLTHFGTHSHNPFEVNLTIVAVEIGHDHKWGCHNPVRICTS